MKRFVSYKKLDAEDTARRFVVYHEKAGARLPSQYQEVEYIQSDGNQWIETNYTHTTNSGARAIIESTSMGGSNLKYILGSQYTAVTTYPYFTMSLTSNQFEFEYGTGITSKYGTATINTKYEMSMNYKNDGKLIADGVEYLSSGVTFNAGQYPVAINGDYINGSVSRIGSYKIYLIELTEGTELVRQFIPCYDTENSNKPGLYELVEGKFYINKGTGTDFTVGADVAIPVPARFVLYYTPRTYLYNAGNECSSLTGGWVGLAVGIGGYTRTEPTITRNATNLIASMSDYRTGAICTNNTINTSLYNKLCIRGTSLMSNIYAQAYVGFISSKTIGASTSEEVHTYYQPSSTSILSTMGETYDVELDIDIYSLTENLYLEFCFYFSCSFTMTQVWLE